jgi:Zn finger protein HypA/HybF involved in hydrogenase expression
MNARLSNIIERLLQNKNQVAVVKLAVGELIPFREEQWRELTRGTALASSALHIRVIRAEQQCMACFEKYHPKNLDTRCPHCGGVGAKIIAGEEFYLEALEEEDE